MAGEGALRTRGHAKEGVFAVLSAAISWSVAYDSSVRLYCLSAHLDAVTVATDGFTNTKPHNKPLSTGWRAPMQRRRLRCS